MVTILEETSVHKALALSFCKGVPYSGLYRTGRVKITALWGFDPAHLLNWEGLRCPGSCYSPHFLPILLAVEKCPQLAMLSQVAHETSHASDALCFGFLPGCGVAKQAKPGFPMAFWGRVNEEDKEGQREDRSCCSRSSQMGYFRAITYHKIYCVSEHFHQQFLLNPATGSLWNNTKLQQISKSGFFFWSWMKIFLRYCFCGIYSFVNQGERGEEDRQAVC